MVALIFRSGSEYYNVNFNAGKHMKKYTSQYDPTAADNPTGFYLKSNLINGLCYTN